MSIKSISNTIQEFQNVRYYKCGGYFQRDGVRLHRKVWEFFKGKIPSGFEIHHKDYNKANNNITNLELLPSKTHRILHASTDEHKTRSKEYIKKAQKSATMWHKSEEGKAWHKKHFQENCKDKLSKKQEKKCLQCSKEFKGHFNSQFCHNNCKAKYRREKGIDDVFRVCKECNKEIKVNKYSRVATCGTICGAKQSSKTKIANNKSRG